MLTGHIPDRSRPAVEAALREVFGGSRLERATPITKGFSGARVIRVEARGRALLLRVETARDALRDPARQYACLAIAAEAGVAPSLRYADPVSGVAVTDFIEARPFADYPGGTAAAVQELGRLTARLRAAARFPDLIDHIEGVDGLLQGALATGVCSPEAIAPHLSAWRDLKAAYPRTTAQDRVSSHNDLNPNNLLYDGQRLWLVDWEAAFANDPLVDPASIALWFGVAKEDEEALLRAAFGRADAGLRASFFLMRQVCLLFNGVLMLMLAAQGRAPGERAVRDFTAPAFADVRAALAAGQVDLGSQSGRVLFAKASLNAMWQAVRSPAFEAAARTLGG